MNIYIGNLPLELTEKELHQEFIPFGEVLSVTIMNDKYIGSGQRYGYGFVEMASRSEARTAISHLTGKVIKGRVIHVVEARPLSNVKNVPSRSVVRFGRNVRVRSF